MALSSLLYSAGLTLSCYALWKSLAWALQPWFSALRAVPGPPNTSLVYGNSRDIYNSDFGTAHERWTQEYGTTFKFKGFLSRNRLYTLDARAINHVLNHIAEFPKPAMSRNNLGRIVGHGLLIAEGDAHRKQRRVMNPAFGPAQVRELTGIFVDKSARLRDALQGLVDPDGAPVRIDILTWLSRATLDMIGLAGFNYTFDALDAKENELNDAFAAMFQAGADVPVLPLLQAVIPPLRLIPTKRDRTIRWAQTTMNTIGRKLIQERKAAIMAENAGGHVAKGDVQGRDLLSLLVRSNMAVDIPDNQRLSDEDMLARKNPYLLCCWPRNDEHWHHLGTLRLTQNPAAQRRLREELLACPTDTPTMDELQALPYLDAVVRETLRLYAPVSNTVRVADQDCVIPLSEPFIDNNGVKRTEIPVGKDDQIVIPILGLHLSTRTWGPDAHEFVPERWLKPLPESAHNMPGVWGNMLTFLAGPRACIGYRFSLMEMKALLFMLVRAFEFELAVPVADIKRKQAIVTRPYVASEKAKGNQLPLLVRAYRP